MSYNGHPVIDADSHIREYIDFDRTFRPHLDPKYRDAFDRMAEAVRARQTPGQEQVLFMTDRAVIGPTPPRRPLGVEDTFAGTSAGLLSSSIPTTETGRGSKLDMACNWDPGIRLRDMDAAQIDVSVMFPSQTDGFCVLRDVGFEQALYQAYHRYVSDYCSAGSGRLRWVANCNMRDIPATLEELTAWTERDENLAGWFISRACPDGRLLDNPALHPLYQRAQELDMPIVIHGGTLRPPLTPGATGLDDSGFMINAFYHGWGGMTAVGALIGGGVFDLFPRLRVAIFESGGGWMPWLAERLDGAYRPKSGMTPNLRRPPSEVLAEGRLFCSVETEEEHLEYAVESLGEDIWLFATDYPHQGSPWPDGVSQIAERDGLSESAKLKIFGGNALRLFARMRVPALA
jgi:predicted TIM-barrel fold metal-dependent hydrolase